MPLYEYKCSHCGAYAEYIQKASDPRKTDCEKCDTDGTLVKQISSPAIQFKGDGWYLTDYSDKGKKIKAEEHKVDDSASKTASSSKKEEKKEAKPAASNTSSSSDS